MLKRGTRLGPYEILDPIGAGGMGEVYRARDEKLDRDVAVKILPEDLLGDPDRLARFEREARAASGLNHPNIIQIYDVDREGSTAYMVMELVEGRALRSLIDQGSIPVRKVLEVGEQTAAGLAKAHAAGITHRDLKPENLMLSDDGVVKILDFGLAKLAIAPEEGGSQIPTALKTDAGVVMGTPGYMSPEQARGTDIDFRSDQFSLGVVLHEMITGTRPFERGSTVQTMTAIIEDDPPPMAAHNERAPRQLQWIVDRCLDKEPQERYASTVDLSRDLRTVREHLSEISGSSPTLTAADSTKRGGSAGLFMGGVALGVIIGLALLFMTWRIISGPPVEPARFSLFSFSGYDRHPAVSPDGRTVAFTSERSGVSRIWLKQIDSSGEAPLTDGPDTYPRFSPDGSQILFGRTHGMGSSLYRVSVLGGEPRKILDDAAGGDWSPDGRKIAFVRVVRSGEKTSGQLGVADLDGGGQTILAEIDHLVVSAPRFSPDGTRVAATTATIGLTDTGDKFVLLGHLDGREQQLVPLALPGGAFSSVAWLATGDDIVYSQGDSATSFNSGGRTGSTGASRIVRQQLSTGRFRVLFWTPHQSAVLDVIGPGKLILDGASARQNLEEYEIEKLPHGEGRSLSPRGASVDRQPIYSPDGKWVTFSSNRSGNLDIWSVSVEDGTLRQLTDHPEEDWDPAYLPDGSLLFSSRRGGNFEIWIAAADGSAPRQVSNDGVDAENASSTPDGGWLVYNSGNPEKVGLWRIRPDGSDATLLLAGTIQWPEISPDGRYVSFATIKRAGVSAIRTVRLEDGELLPFEIEIRSSDFAGGRHRWVPGTSSLAFTGENEAGRHGVFVQEFALDRDTSPSRRPLVLFGAGELPESFGFSPDGKRLTLARDSHAWTLLTIEGLPDVDVPPRGTNPFGPS